MTLVMHRYVVLKSNDPNWKPGETLCLNRYRGARPKVEFVKGLLIRLKYIGVAENKTGTTN